MKKINKLIVVFGILLSFWLMTGTSQAILFDFDSLAQGDGSILIGNYMTATYGSNVTVTGAFVNKAPDLLGPDSHIVNRSPAEDTGLDIIRINFLDIPIQSMQFDWEVNWNTTVVTDTIDFRWVAFDQNGNVVDTFTYDLIGNQDYSGNSGLILFSNPVSRLLFTNNLIHQIGVDSLNVTPVPEPNTLILLVLGTNLLIFFAWKRIKKQVRKVFPL